MGGSVLLTDSIEGAPVCATLVPLLSHLWPFTRPLPPPPRLFSTPSGHRNVWRDAAFLFNSFGCTGDLLEKAFVYIVVASLCGIGIGAHAAFGAASHYVAGCAFFALFFIAATAILYGSREPRLRGAASPAGGTPRRRRPLWAALRTNFVVVVALANMAAATPYLAAAFVRSPSTVVRLYWTGTALALLRTSLLPLLVRLAAARSRASLIVPAVNIEAISEKYTLLTLSTLTWGWQGGLPQGGGGGGGAGVRGSARMRVVGAWARRAWRAVGFREANFLSKWTSLGHTVGRCWKCLLLGGVARRDSHARPCR